MEVSESTSSSSQLSERSSSCGEPLLSANIGVLGHVDSGKTSLCKALSTTASTAAFDSNPQSQERGITLDLGFSALTLNDKYRITLVDCPGHASLIRTVLGGTQIMDFMILVIDATKGMQAQTWECLILASIVCPEIIVVLNKVDLIEDGVRDKKVKKLTDKLREVLDKTGDFGFVPVVKASTVDSAIGVEGVRNAIEKKLELISFDRDTKSPLVLAVDHCFTIRGAGAVCTGTILQGTVKIGDSVEFPELQMTKKVKTMQIFKKPVEEAMAGDRVALGIPGLDSKLVERGIICAPGLIPTASKAAVIKIFRIEYFKDPLESQRRYHVTIGYSTVTAMLQLFSSDTPNDTFDKDSQYKYVKQLGDSVQASGDASKTYFAILEFDKSVVILPKTLVIASNLQSQEGSAKVCRLAFHGQIVESIYDKDYKKTYLPTLNLYWLKTKKGTVDRVLSADTIVAKGFCQKQSNIDHLMGLRVSISQSNLDSQPQPEENQDQEITGRIQSRFGQTNKVRISVESQLSDTQVNKLKASPACVNLVYKEYKFKQKPGTGRRLIQ